MHKFILSHKILFSLQVASIVGRAEVLSCIFFLLSLLSYLKAITSIKYSSHLPLQQTRWMWVMVCVFFSACSLLSKEQGVTVLGVCAGYDVFLNWEVLLRVLTELCRGKRKRKISGEQVVVNEMILLTENAENKEVASTTQILNGETTPKIVKFNSSSSGKHKRASTNESSDSPSIGTIVGRIGKLLLLHIF